MSTKLLNQTLDSKYKFGFTTKVKTIEIPPGLNIETVKYLSKIRSEPRWLLEIRMKAYKRFLKMEEPHWLAGQYQPIDYQKIKYFASPKNFITGKKQDQRITSLEEVDPKIIETFNKLGISLKEQQRLTGVAVDAVFDSVSVKTTFKKKLSELGVIFCPLSEAARNYSDLLKQYLFSVVSPYDNFFACLNAAVFSEGSFVYIPKGVNCPVELSTYFRLNTPGIGQFERTLIIADTDSQVSYLEGCTAPGFKQDQLHAAVVEIVALDRAEVKYSTVQNWYPGNANGKGGVLNFVTKRGLCKGRQSKISWVQLETGSKITWKYPSVVLKGDDSVGEFYSVAVTKGFQQADTGSKMTHLGKNTKSYIISKSISAEKSRASYRGLVKITPKAEGSKNYTQCDSLLIGNKCKANTFPVIDCKNSSSLVLHEAQGGRLQQDVLFYLNSRGLNTEKSRELAVTGFCKKVIDKLPLEFMIEGKKLLEMSLKNTTG